MSKGPDFPAMQAACDPLLFPGKASEELLAKMPPTIIWEEEFDMYITPATRYTLPCQSLLLLGTILHVTYYSQHVFKKPGVAGAVL